MNNMTEIKAVPKLDLDLEVKSGTHIKGEKYPTHDFSALECLFKDDSPEKLKLILAVNNEMVKTQIDEAHAKNPDKDTVKYFYLAPKE